MKLLVGVDLSEPTALVLEQVERIASGLDAKVYVMHVADPEPDFVGMDVGPQAERDAWADKYRDEHAHIQRLSNDLRKADIEATALLVQGPTVQTLLKEAAKLGADMIVLGSHGKGAVHKLLVGSVSEGVLRHADIPVVIVPVHDRA